MRFISRMASLRLRQVLMFWRFLMAWALVVLVTAAIFIHLRPRPSDPLAPVQSTTPTFSPTPSAVTARALGSPPQPLTFSTTPTSPANPGSPHTTSPDSSTHWTMTSHPVVTTMSSSFSSTSTLTPMTTLFASITSSLLSSSTSVTATSGGAESGKTPQGAPNSAGPTSPSPLSPKDRATLLQRRCQEHMSSPGGGEIDRREAARAPSLLTQLSLVLLQENDLFFCSVPQVWSPAWNGLLRALEDSPPPRSSGREPQRGRVPTTTTLGPETDQGPLLTLLDSEEDHKSYILRHWQGVLFARSPWDRLVSAFLGVTATLSSVRSLCVGGSVFGTGPPNSTMTLMPGVTRHTPEGSSTMRIRGSPGGTHNPMTSTRRQSQEATEHPSGPTMRPLGFTKSLPEAPRRHLGNDTNLPRKTDPKTEAPVVEEPYCSVHEIQKLSLEVERDSSVCPPSQQSFACRLPPHLDFDEFLKQVLAAEEVTSVVASATMNITHPATTYHLLTLSRICQPCQINYSFVGEYDTLEDDVRRFLRDLGRQDLIESVGVGGRDAENFAAYRKTLLERADPRLLQEFAHLFAEDFFLFGYDPKPT
ncbi:uncharacterized protein LOC143033973 [Oratosquilla oratoria]|uniref:uncharacterized protein LOC143033973 n=1 Tax=Oratosquilla oratoria TaxID=337810 RepID=UPI003F7642C3